MMRNRIIIPELDERFFYGAITGYEFIGTISRNKGKYRVRYRLFFRSGKEYTGQKSGFGTKADAMKYRDTMLVELSQDRFMPFVFTFKQVCDYWLYHVKLVTEEVTLNTFQSYRNAMYKYMIPILGEKRMVSVTANDLVEILMSVESENMYERVFYVCRVLFSYAYKKNYIRTNPYLAVLEIMKEKRPITRRKKRNIYWNVQTIRHVLLQCRENYPDLYMPLLLSLCTGCRISELLALKYRNVDFSKADIHIQYQMGHTIDRETFKVEVSETASTKTEAGVRVIPVASWVIDELIVKRAWYEEQKRTAEPFYDGDFICCAPDGHPLHRGSFYKDFKALLQNCGLKDMHWHDLRHVYASMLRNNAVNMKAISVYLGHGSERTSDIYIDRESDQSIDCTMIEQSWLELKPVNIQETELLYIPFPDDFLKKLTGFC